MAKAVLISWAKAKLAASKRLHFKSKRTTEAMLEFAAGSLTEAYRIGAEEAQSEIMRRINHLRPPVSASEGAKP